MPTIALPRLSADLQALAARAMAAYERLSPSERLRHRYEQRRSFARGMCASSTPYEKHCAAVDARMPSAVTLTDAQIGLILMGERHA